MPSLADRRLDSCRSGPVGPAPLPAAGTTRAARRDRSLATAGAKSDWACSPGGAGRIGAQLLSYTVIGMVMTLAYLSLYAGLRPVLGAQPANLLAWVLTAVADTAANRRLTFGRVGRLGAVRAQAQGLLVFAVSLALTSGALLGLASLAAHPATWLQLGVLVAANVLAGLLRFTVLRGWVFASSAAPTPAQVRYARAAVGRRPVSD